MKHSSRKKYGSSSDEDSGQRPEKIKKQKDQKNRYSRASDDEYSSDFFDPPKRVDFKSYVNIKRVSD